MKLSKDEFINKLKEELLRIDLVISEEQLSQLYEYKELLEFKLLTTYQQKGETAFFMS